MLEYRRYRDAGRDLAAHFESQRGYMYRSAPLPVEFRRLALDAAEVAYEPDQLTAALGDLLQPPERPDLSHIKSTVSLKRRLSVLRSALTQLSRFDFDDQFGDEDRLTQAVTIFALLELYSAGEAVWEQSENCGPITVRRTAPAMARTA
jgi:segregation and condensation protein A